MTQALALAQSGFRSWLARVFVAAVALTVLSYGSASTVEVNLAALSFAILAIFSIFQPIGSWRVGRVHAVAIFVLAGLVGYAALQTVPLPGWDLANGAWKSVSEIIAPVNGTISVAPGMTLDALTTLALPFLAFVVALAFFQGDDEALWLWRALAYFGAAYAAFGIAQELLAPDQLLFEPKKFYVGYLTATFVNRNTAGTFFGVALLLNLALLFADLRTVHVAHLAQRRRKDGERRTALLIHLFAVLDCAAALSLTRSRGAVGATLIAILLATGAMAARRLTADRPRDDVFGRWRRPAVSLAAVAVVGSLFMLFAGRAEQRVQGLASEDGRWCAFGSTMAAIADHWPLGAGFGAFPDVFPAYRDAACAGIFGVWDHAHNFFLEGLLTLGAAFAAAAAIVYAALGAALVRGARTRHRLRFLPVAGLAALALVSLHGIVDFSLQIPGVAVYVAAALAPAVAVALGGDAKQAGVGVENRPT